MSSPHLPVERIGLDHLRVAVPALHALGRGDDADVLDANAQAFCDALLVLRRVDPLPLRDETGLPLDPLVGALLQAADTLRLEGDPEGLGSWCAALAGRLGALFALRDPIFTGVRVFAEEYAGTGRLALVSVRLVDLDLLFGDEAER
jgi:hypothetical protein